MRFTEIANPEEQLALWKLVSDKMWAAFGQQVLQKPDTVKSQQRVTTIPMSTPKPMSRMPTKPLGKSKSTPVKAQKPKKVTLAPASKPLHKPRPQQLTPTQASKKQTQQYHQKSNYIHQALTKKPLIQTSAQLTQPKAPVIATMVPLHKSFSGRDKDELVFHKSQNPLNPQAVK